jgi:hypothetical protein
MRCAREEWYIPRWMGKDEGGDDEMGQPLLPPSYATVFYLLFRVKLLFNL